MTNPLPPPAPRAEFDGDWATNTPVGRICLDAIASSQIARQTTAEPTRRAA